MKTIVRTDFGTFEAKSVVRRMDWVEIFEPSLDIYENEKKTGEVKLIIIPRERIISIEKWEEKKE